MLLGSFVEEYDREEGDSHNSFDSSRSDHPVMSPRTYRSPEGHEIRDELPNGTNFPTSGLLTQDY